MLGPVKRIEWSHDVPSVTFNPITNFSDPNLACRENARPPALKAPARAGAEVGFFWTPITRMHYGPALAYLGYMPTPDTKPQDVKFFKIYEKGFDPTLNKWANQIASDNSDSWSIKLPSDIKPGTYVLRTELIALHGNMKELKNNQLRAQIQVYPYCFNLEISGSGTATPEGVNFPGAYKPTDPAFTFQPFMTYGNDTKSAREDNMKFVAPGPPVYKGAYSAPTGPLPTVQQTGAYPPDLEVKYQDLIRKIERPALKLATYINAAWPGYTADAKVMAKYGGIGKEAAIEGREVMSKLKPEIEAFKMEAAGKEV